ncbi:hypothetical protein ASD21_13215 [Caulobacter sp. Root1455]|nr:hypothetical protein ASD21_13215 [Caulobacter sp. Root1455]
MFCVVLRAGVVHRAGFTVTASKEIAVNRSARFEQEARQAQEALRTLVVLVDKELATHDRVVEAGMARQQIMVVDMDEAAVRMGATPGHGQGYSGDINSEIAIDDEPQVLAEQARTASKFDDVSTNDAVGRGPDPKLHCEGVRRMACQNGVKDLTLVQAIQGADVL